jgi:ATP dependent DNA ligase domain
MQFHSVEAFFMFSDAVRAVFSFVCISEPTDLNLPCASRVSPTLRPDQCCPPAGKDWLHEPKWDGYRFQIVKNGLDVRLYSRSGAEYKPTACHTCARHSPPCQRAPRCSTASSA